MINTDFASFRALVLGDADLRGVLLKADDREEFVQTVVDLAEQSGFEVTRADVEDALTAGRKAWIERWI